MSLIDILKPCRIKPTKARVVRLGISTGKGRPRKYTDAQLRAHKLEYGRNWRAKNRGMR